MTHRITLPPPLEEKLRQRIAAAGTDAETFIVETLNEKLGGPRSFREIFAPLHEAFDKAPISADELAALVDQAREEHYRRMHNPQAKAS